MQYVESGPALRQQPGPWPHLRRRCDMDDPTSWLRNWPRPVSEAWWRAFWAKIEKTETCWLWRGTIQHLGYAVVKIPGQHTTTHAHRVTYRELTGPVPDDRVVHHLCGVKHCVNPEHLTLLSNRDNILQGGNPPAKQARQTICKRGHSLIPGDGDVRVEHGRRRHCRECARFRRRAKLEGTWPT